MKSFKHGTIAVCLICKKEFERRSWNNQLCSKECALKHWHNRRKNSEYYKTRFTVLERDGFKCQYCGADPRSNKKVKLQVDHIKPKEKGGTDDLNNLVTACQACNLGKTNTFYPEIFNKIT